MTEYISREAALDRIIGYDFQHCPDYMEDWSTELKHAVICDLKDAVETLPAADVAPVVRCINCRHGWAYFDASMPGGPYVLCGKPYAAPRETHKFDYFCADGKPKEDEA